MSSLDRLYDVLRGQSLFEVILSLGIAAMILLAVVSLSTTSVRNTTFSSNESLSTYYAQEATEWLREVKDSNWKSFHDDRASDAGKKWCLKDTDWTGGVGDCDPTTENIIGVPGLFREVVLTRNSDVEVEAIVTVGWTDAQGDHEVKNITIFTDWRGS